MLRSCRAESSRRAVQWGTMPRSTWIILALAVVLALVCPAPASARNVSSHLKVYPNPSRGPVHVWLATKPTDIEIRATVHDLSGRLVRTIRDGPILPGDHGETDWDGRTTSGQRVPSGFYWILIRVRGQISYDSVVKVWIIR